MTSGNAAVLALVAGMVLSSAGCAGAQRTDDARRRVRLAMGEQLGRQGDWGGAFRAASAICDESGDADACVLRARALRHSGALDEAEAGLRRVVAKHPDSASAHVELAVLCEHLKRPEEALVHHREALRLERSPRTLNNLGFALYLRGQAREAIPLLEEGLRAAPGDGRLRNNLGFALAAAGDYARAARQFELGGTKAQAQNNLGLAYELGRNLPQAYDAYLEAVRLEPAAPAARGNLDRVARELGRAVPAVAGAGEIGGG